MCRQTTGRGEGPTRPSSWHDRHAEGVTWSEAVDRLAHLPALHLPLPSEWWAMSLPLLQVEPPRQRGRADEQYTPHASPPFSPS